MKRCWTAVLLLVMSLLSLPLSAPAGLSPDRVWEDIPTGARAALSSGPKPWISPDIFRLSRLDESSLEAVLTGARTRGSTARQPCHCRN
jgi:hypothetical protein